MPSFPIRRVTRGRTSRLQPKSPRGFAIDRLEDRRMLAILPGQVVTSASYIDADGDAVAIAVTGTVPQGAGFTVELAGQATDNADATRINLSGLTVANGLQVVVTPKVLASQPGGNFATLYSPGYTNVAFLSNLAPAVAMTALGGIQLSAAVVHSMSLEGIAVGSITLDAGEAPFCDRINSQNNQQGTDSKMYQPVTGLIDLGGITAGSIDSLVINGAISAPTGNPFDTSVTNDFRSVINVSGSIGSVIGLRSSLAGAIRAQSIGSVRVANIAGEITTRGSDPFSINLPSDFKGFINAGGHLHLGFPLSDGAKITGQINAAGGISGSDKSSTTDTLFLPGEYAGSFTNTSQATGIADIAIDGEGLLTIYSATSVGDISADAFGADFVVEAGGAIGSIEAGQGALAGHLQAGVDIGAVRTIGNVLATLKAGRDIGTITTITGSLESPSIQAGRDIGAITTHTGILGTSIVAGGDLGAILIANGDVELSYIRARDIVGVTVVDGGIQTTSLVADRDIGDITTFGSIGGFGIQDVSMVAGGDIGKILSRAHTGYGIRELKLDAQGDIASVTGISFGEFGSLDGAGILDSNFLAANIDAVFGRGVGGGGIESTRIVTRTAASGAAIDRSTGRVGAVTGEGWLDGLLGVTVVAHSDIGAITGISFIDGSGISGGSYDANYGAIGQITAAGGAAGGFGIEGTRFQATDLTSGRIAGIMTSANANGRDAMAEAKVYAGSIGPISATVHGGLDGNGIVGSEIRAFGDAIDSVSVDVRSINGVGIQEGKITASGDFGPLTVKTFNATGISGGEFQSRGNFGDISVVAEKGGNGIENAVFTAPGRIFYDTPYGALSLDHDPKGNFGRITVDANGTNAVANGIVGTKFSAIGDIGLITVRTKGATAIVDSTFAADTDGDYTGTPSLTSPGQNTGTIAGITAVAAGRNRQASSGIVRSTFTAAMVGNVTAAIQAVEGGDGIVDSRFEARTAIYDGFGNYDNVGRIGNVTVTNAADQPDTGAGIRGSQFFAGAGGEIGNIAVTTTAGSGIVASSFDASIRGVVFDPDQNLFTSTIGTVTVNSGRVAGFTFVPAGITLSTFTAAAGIGAVTVNSVGSGITGSIFEADFDWQLVNDATGAIGNITVRVPGRNASAVTGSVFGGFALGNIEVRLAADARNGVNAVALSNFNARGGAIGNVIVVHSMTGLPYSTGTGYAILTSSFIATTAIGTVSITGNTLGAVFIVGGQPVQPVVFQARLVGMQTIVNPIGAVTLNGGQTHALSFTAPALVGFSYATAPANATVRLTLNASFVGFVDVAAPIGSASLDISGGVVALGDVTVDGALTLVCPSATAVGTVKSGGNASLSTSALQTLGGLNVAGTLSLPQGLPSLRQCGDVRAFAFASVARNVQIGAGTAGSSMGRVRITSANRGKGVYQFAFANWPNNSTQQNPIAIVAGRSIVNVTTRPQTVNGVGVVRMAKK
jgi:hypothetical protein